MHIIPQQQQQEVYNGNRRRLSQVHRQENCSYGQPISGHEIITDNQIIFLFGKF